MSTDSKQFYTQAPPHRGASSFVYPPSTANLEFFAQALAHKCLVAIPTETVYGLAGLALNEESCRSIFQIKGRPLVDPLIVHVSGLEMAERVAELTEEAKIIAAAFWPGPLTLILKKKPIVPDIVTAGKPTVAIRMPAHPVAAALLKITGQPLAAPSANPFGYISPTLPQHVKDSFGDQVPFIIDGGACEIGIESTILDLTFEGSPQILRPGAISAEQIGKQLGSKVEIRQVELSSTDVADAPGTFERHYSPGTPLNLFSKGSQPDPEPHTAVIYLKRPEGVTNLADTYWLSEDGDPETISRSLFGLLRQLDQAGYKGICCELPSASSEGIALAIRDRLNRAAAK